MKTELEEAAKKHATGKSSSPVVQAVHTLDFMAGALWQQEQAKKMYSEEDVRDAYRWGTLVNQGTKEHFNEFINNLKTNNMENGKKLIHSFNSSDYSQGNFDGLTKREYFAGLAMQGILASNTEGLAHGHIDISGLIQSAVKATDALLAELEKA
jgi:hypothetical protein